MEQRKNLFFKTVKNKNWRFLIANAIIGLLFTGYFIQIFEYHITQVDKVKYIQDRFPIFIEKY